MKGFIKNVFANIVAILLLCSLVIGFFVVMLISSSIAGDSRPTVKSNSVLVLNFKNPVIESSSEISANLFDFGSKKEIYLQDILSAIEKAKTDDKIKGISIEADNLPMGTTQTDAVRRALEDFKKSGKFVYGYGNAISQGAYYLASVADKFFLNPAGGIELKGLSTEVVFLKSFAEKYGIGIDVIRHGKYKAAVEPFLRDDISPENREQLATMLNDVWSGISSKMAKSRKIAPAEFQQAANQLYGFIPQTAMQYKLADQLLQKGQYDDLLKDLTHKDKSKKPEKVSIVNYIKTLSRSQEQNSTGEIAVLNAAGQIFSGEGSNGIYSEDFIKEIRKIAEDDKIKSVVLRINSPGGSANASDEILFELQQLRKKKPLIVSFGDYAASGGYYIAMAGEKIYSEPRTLTGSIGVFGLIWNAKDLATRNGIHSDIVSTNDNAQIYSPLSGAAPGTLNMMQRSVEQTYNRFVGFVMQNRKKTFEEIDAIGGGRVWSGTRAKELGLVDELGGLDAAVKYAAGRAGLKTYNVANYPKAMNRFEKLFKNSNEDDLMESYFKTKIGESNYSVIQMLNDKKKGEGNFMQSFYRVSLD